MFSQTIIENDAFLDMPLSTQMLYVHLSMNADDYGFVSPKRVMRMVGANEDDLKLLLLKRYLLSFESGVVVIKHWHLNNTIRKDRSIPTTYDKELKTLTNNEYGAYTEIEKVPISVAVVEQATTNYVEKTEADNQPSTNRQPYDNQMSPQKQNRSRIEAEAEAEAEATRAAARQPAVRTKEIDDMFLLWEIEVGYALTARRKMNREYASKIIKEYPPDDIRPMLKVVGLSQDDQYAPRVSDFIQLYRKWDDLKGWVRRKKAAGTPAAAPIKFRSAR